MAQPRSYGSINGGDAQQPLLGGGRPRVVSRNKLGTFNGVFIPCSLNIMGVVLFLRLGWAVGQAGVLGVLSMFAVGELQTVLTVLSITAIVTNGTVKGGGAYFVISRCMGAAFGGSIGVLFYLVSGLPMEPNRIDFLLLASRWSQIDF